MKNRRTATIFYATLALLMCLATGATGAPDVPEGEVEASLKAVSGRWYTEGREGGVELYPCDGHVCGRFFWLKDDMETHTVSHDEKNPDPAERQRPLCHMQFMGNFSPDGRNHYFDGWIYNPRDGGIYSAQMKLIDHDTLDLHGYLFFPFLGQSQIWKRAKTMPSCLSD